MSSPMVGPQPQAVLSGAVTPPSGPAPSPVAFPGQTTPTAPTPDLSGVPSADQTAVTNTPQPKVVESHPAWHSFVNAMTGSGADYEQTPNGPVLKPQTKAQKLFSGVLTGAMMGLGAGAESPYFGKGAAMGAGAGLKGQQEQQQKAQQQAQQQFENKQSADRASDEHTHVLALTAQANMGTLKDALEVQGMSQAQHDQLVANDKGEVEGLRAVGMKPAGPEYTDVPESKALTMEHQPGYSSQLRWLATGVAPVRDQNGSITSYQNTYSAFDVNGLKMSSQIPLNPSMISNWKDSGYLESYPNLLTSRVIKTNPDKSQSISYADLRKIDVQAGPMLAAKQKKQQQADAEQEIQDRHSTALAAQARDTAAADADKTRGGRDAWEFKTEKDTRAANVAYQKTGWGPLTADQKYLVQPLIQKNINDAEALLNSKELKDELDSTDPSVQKEAIDKAHEYRDTIESESKKLMGPAEVKKDPPPPPPDTPSALLLGKMQQDDKIQPGTFEAYHYILNSSVSPKDKNIALRDSKTPMPWIEATRAADQLIAQTPMSREAALRKVIEKAQTQGVTVAPRPNTGTIFSPYPDLSSTNVAAPTKQ